MRRTRFGEVVRSMKLRGLCGVFLLALAAAFSPPGALANTTYDAGALWLLASQGQDGSWRSVRDERGLRTTALAVSALGGDFATIPARSWLKAQAALSLEEASEAAGALGEETTATLLAPVEGLRVSSGHWSGAVGHGADPYHTALAVLALTASGKGSQPEYRDAVSYFRALQHQDGSWGTQAVSQETATVTALVVRAALSTGLSPTSDSDLNGIDDMCDAARTWLLSTLALNADGGFWVGGASVSATGEVFATLRWLGLPFEVESAAVSFLESRFVRDESGFQGWWLTEGGQGAPDAWASSHALNCLTGSGGPNLAFSPGGLTYLHEPAPGDRVPMRFSVVNRGTLPTLPTVARLTLRPGTEAQNSSPNTPAEAVFSQDFNVTTLSPGAWQLFELTLSTEGLQGNYTVWLDLDPEGAVAESIEGDNRFSDAMNVWGERNFHVAPGSLKLFTSDGVLELPSVSIASGTSVIVRAGVTLSGDRDADGVEVLLYATVAGGERVLVGSTVLYGLLPDTTTTVEFPWIVSVPPGSVSLEIEINANDVFGETVLTDNVFDLTVGVGSPDSVPPPVPEGLAGNLASKDKVDLYWWPTDAPDLAGYRVYRDGFPLNAINVAPLSSPSASHSFNLRDYLPEKYKEFAADPPNLIDGNKESMWWSTEYPFDEWEPEKCYVQFDLDRPRDLRGVVIYWPDFDFGASDFRVFFWDGATWVEKAEVRGNVLDRSTVLLPHSVVTTKVRILLDMGIQLSGVGIREVELLEAGPGRIVTSNTFADTTLPGLPATYTVTAVDTAGNESEHSAPFYLEDLHPALVKITSPAPNTRVGPEVVVTGTVTDDFLQGYYLDYVLGAHPEGDLDNWIRVDQSGEPVVNGVLFNWMPPKNLDGWCTIRVRAVDGSGAARNIEKRLVLWVDTTPPARPEGLTVEGSGLEASLNWLPNHESDLAGYYVYQNGEERGEIDIAATGIATASDTFSDGFMDRTPGMAIDPDKKTYWRPGANKYPCWWRVDFNEPHTISGVVTRWESPMVPKDLAIQTLDVNGNWITRKRIYDNGDSELTVDFASSLSTKAVRIWIYEGAQVYDPDIPELSVEAAYPVLNNVAVLADEIVTQPNATTAIKENRDYGFTVQAVDDLGNRSSMSQAAVYDTFGPAVAIVSPINGSEQGRAVVIAGVAEDRYFKDYTIEVTPVEAKDAPLAGRDWEQIYWSMVPVGPNSLRPKVGPAGCPVASGSELMTVWYPVMRKGWFALRVTARDQLDHQTVKTSYLHLDAMPPAPPTDLEVAKVGQDAELSWEASTTEADLSGALTEQAKYRIYRDMIPLNVPDVAYFGTVVTNKYPGGEKQKPYYINDGLKRTFWLAQPFKTNVEVYIDLPQPYLVDKIDVHWAATEWYWCKSYSIEAWDKIEGAWREIGQSQTSIAPSVSHSFEPFLVERVRVTMRKGMTDFVAGGVDEIIIFNAIGSEPITATSYLDPYGAVSEGTYRVTALDGKGNESVKSQKVTLDFTPPRVALTSPVEGEVHLPTADNLLGENLCPSLAGYLCQPVKGYVDIWGTVEDVLLESYEVHVGKGENPGSWQSIGGASYNLTSKMTQTKLASWKLPVCDQGWYTIRLSAKDENGAYSETRVKVFIDTQPPTQPGSLTAALQGDNTWSPRWRKGFSFLAGQG